MKISSLLEMTGKNIQLIPYHQTLILTILKIYIKVTFVWILDPLREAHLYIQGRMELLRLEDNLQSKQIDSKIIWGELENKIIFKILMI